MARYIQLKLVKHFLRGANINRKICLVCVIFFVCIMSFNRKRSVIIYLDKQNFVSYWPRSIDHASVERYQTPLILLWTLFFGDLWENFYDPFNSKISTCDHKCTFTYNHSQIDSADLIVFNARDMHSQASKYIAFPPNRSLDQIWMLHNTEAPWFTFLDLRLYSDVFNWTSFVRSDADAPTHYGRITPIVKKAAIGQEAQVIGTDPARDILLEKLNFAVWLASNCYSSNAREDYVARLNRYVPIDVFGACSGNSADSCRRYSEECNKRLKTYKFYLAFENANCRDYITEKLWRAYEYEAIPVVMGRPENYRKYAPPGSYVDTADFSSPEELAAFLLQLSTDSARYNSYFKWRQEYRMVQTYWCDLCTAMHRRNRSVHQSYHDLHGWHVQDTCSPWSLSERTFIVARYFANKVLRHIY